MIRDIDDMHGHPSTRLRLDNVKLAFSGPRDLPSEIRLFQAGWNRTAKGNFLFDALSAQAVMSDFAKKGSDLSIDLEHLSLDEESRAYDPDARGWGKLELRDGELWLVSIRWTPDGAKRLRNRTQRYVSPTFAVSKKTARILSIFNIAICANPATYDAPQLVAASARLRTRLRASAPKRKPMDPETLKKLASRLGLADGATMEDCMAAIDALKAAALDEPDDNEDGDDEEEASDDNEPGEGDEDTAEASLTAADVKDLPAKAQAIILAQSQSIAALSKQVKSIGRSVKTNEVDRILAENTDKIPKHMEGWARSQSPQNLRVYLKHAKPVTAAHRADEPQRRGSDESQDEVRLTAADERIAKLTGTKPKDVLEQRKKLKAREDARERG